MFLLIDKPKGITSHDVVDKVREIVGENPPKNTYSGGQVKVGHAGTLDPNATGLLIVGVGRDSTKKLSLITKDKKTYEAEVYFGEERDTDDDEGMVISKAQGVLAPSKEEIDLTLSNFIGTQEQIPPPYSAIKLKGKKAYELARKGKNVELKPRKITVYSIKALSYSYPTLEIETIVSSGTYIRALARDIGKRLGMGAYLKNLRRTKIGNYDIKNAVALDELSKHNWRESVLEL